MLLKRWLNSSLSYSCVRAWSTRFQTLREGGVLGWVVGGRVAMGERVERGERDQGEEDDTELCVTANMQEHQ